MSVCVRSFREVLELFKGCHQEGMVVDSECDSHQGGVKGIKEVCQLVERCDGHGET